MKKASGAEPASSIPGAARPSGRPGGPWPLVVAAFVLLVAVYVVVLHFARVAQIRDVPLEPKGVHR